MAKKKSVEETSAVTQSDATDAPKMSLMDFFTSYKDFDIEVAEAQKSVDAVEERRSKFVADFCNARGTKGPFINPLTGRQMRAVCRKSYQKDEDGNFVLDEAGKKIPTGKVLWFFTGPKGIVVTE